MIFYVAKAKQLGQQTVHAKCDNCNSTTNQKVSTFWRYAHIYWIPFFPIGKKSVSECQSCYKTFPKNQFNQSLQSAASLNMPKTPITHWSGGIIIALLLRYMVQFCCKSSWSKTRTTQWYGDEIDKYTGWRTWFYILLD